ncbi:mycocerosic acid synthase [Colletotrichum incanum]|nr:mycocerosic acid synthase [Colletotrichum incanum]
MTGLDIESSIDSAELQLLAPVGKALPNIVSGAIEPLDVMLQDNLLSQNYESGTLTGDYEAAVAYLKLLTFKNPRLRFIENGAVGLPVEQYTFTYISSGFFEEARNGFARWEEVVDFRTLDADADPVEQGFEPESYDVVIAANVLHATRKIDLTTSRVRKLFKSGASLVLLEIVPRGAAVGLVAGTLTGWWAQEDEFRIDTPLLHREQWEGVLSRNGFGGIHVARGCMMIAKAAPSQSNGTLARHRAILLRDSVDERCCWDQVDIGQDSNNLYLVVDRADKPLLLESSPQLVKAIKALLGARHRVLWVFFQATADPASSEYIGLVNVLIRVLRLESGNTGLITLDIRHPAPRSEETVSLIIDVARRCFWSAIEHQRSLEPEFAYTDGRFLILRVKPDAEFLKWVRSGRKLDAAAETTTIPYRSGRVLKAEVATPGLLSSLGFVEDADKESHDVKPSQSQIVVEVKAHGVNYKDLCVAPGQMGPDTQMAGEFAGVVRAVAEDM